MPLSLLAEIYENGLSSVPYAATALKIAPCLLVVYLLKAYFGGAKNTAERNMHSKVVMITGGTAGIGASIARALAERGAQIILLTRHPPSDPFLAEYVEDLRSQTSNELIYAEQVDLVSLHSIRLFATKWVDNAPPRRLDMVILCANTMKPPFSRQNKSSADGVEHVWAVNYLANYHLLSILSPALRAQPPDRDVRVIMATCPSYIGAEMVSTDEEIGQKTRSSTGIYGASKLALTIFARNFQKHLETYARPDKKPNNARVIMVDPGWTRTPGMRRWMSAGSLWGLLFYLISWPLWWLLLKAPEQGSQSFLHAVMDEKLRHATELKLIKECREVDFARKEIHDEKVGKKLWEASEKRIQALEKEGAIKRAQAKKADGVKADNQSTSTAKDDKSAGTRQRAGL